MRKNQEPFVRQALHDDVGDIEWLEHATDAVTARALTRAASSSDSAASASMAVFTPMGHRQLTAIPRDP